MYEGEQLNSGLGASEYLHCIPSILIPLYLDDGQDDDDDDVICLDMDNMARDMDSSQMALFSRIATQIKKENFDLQDIESYKESYKRNIHKKASPPRRTDTAAEPLLACLSPTTKKDDHDKPFLQTNNTTTERFPKFKIKQEVAESMKNKSSLPSPDVSHVNNSPIVYIKVETGSMSSGDCVQKSPLTDDLPDIDFDSQPNSPIGSSMARLEVSGSQKQDNGELSGSTLSCNCTSNLDEEEMENLDIIIGDCLISEIDGNLRNRDRAKKGFDFLECLIKTSKRRLSNAGARTISLVQQLLDDNIKVEEFMEKLQKNEELLHDATKRNQSTFCQNLSVQNCRVKAKKQKLNDIAAFLDKCLSRLRKNIADGEFVLDGISLHKKSVESTSKLCDASSPLPRAITVKATNDKTVPLPSDLTSPINKHSYSPYPDHDNWSDEIDNLEKNQKQRKYVENKTAAESPTKIKRSTSASPSDSHQPQRQAQFIDALPQPQRKAYRRAISEDTIHDLINKKKDGLFHGPKEVKKIYNQHPTCPGNSAYTAKHSRDESKHGKYAHVYFSAKDKEKRKEELKEIELRKKEQREKEQSEKTKKIDKVITTKVKTSEPKSAKFIVDVDLFHPKPSSVVPRPPVRRSNITHSVAASKAPNLTNDNCTNSPRSRSPSSNPSQCKGPPHVRTAYNNRKNYPRRKAETTTDW